MPTATAPVAAKRSRRTATSIPPIPSISLPTPRVVRPVVGKSKKYRVLKPIEWGVGLDAKLYAPAAGYDPAHPRLNYYQNVYGWAAAPEMVESASRGSSKKWPGKIPVDLSGVIELSDDDAAQFKHGQIAPLDPDAPATDVSGIVDAELQRKKGYPGSSRIQGSPPEPGKAMKEEEDRKGLQDE